VSVPPAQLVAGKTARVDDYPVDLAWSEGRLVVGGGEGQLALIDPASGAVRPLGTHAPGVLRLAVLGTPARLISAGQDGSVRRWDLAAETPEGQVVHRGTAWPEALTPSPDGRSCAFAAGRAVHVCDADGAPLHRFEPVGKGASLIAWRGRLPELAAAGQTSAWLCETASGRITQVDLEGGPLSLAYSPDGRVLAAGLQDGVVSFRYVATQKKSRMSGYDGKVTHTTWSANSRYLATAASGASTVIIWDFGGKGPEGSMPMQLGTHDDRIEALDFQPVGNLLASAGRDGRLALWRPGPGYKPSRDGQSRDGKGPLPQALDVHLLAGTPAVLRWSPDGRQLALAQADGRIAFFDVKAA
jgi:WD40 repeat protein